MRFKYLLPSTAPLTGDGRANSSSSSIPLQATVSAIVKDLFSPMYCSLRQHSPASADLEGDTQTWFSTSTFLSHGDPVNKDVFFWFTHAKPHTQQHKPFIAGDWLR